MKHIISTIYNDVKNYKYYIVLAFLLGSLYINYQMYGVIKKQDKYLILGAKYLDTCNKECDMWSNKYFEAKRENNLLIDSCWKEIIKLQIKSK